MPAPASLAITPFFILSRPCEAHESPRRHLPVACHVITTSLRAAALGTALEEWKFGSQFQWGQWGFSTAGSLALSASPERGHRCHCWLTWKHHGLGQWEGAGEAHTCAWYFNHLPPCYSPEMGNRANCKQRLRSGSWLLITGKGKLYLRLSKEMRRNFITEWMYHVDIGNILCLRPFCLLLQRSPYKGQKLY